MYIYIYIMMKNISYLKTLARLNLELTSNIRGGSKSDLVTCIDWFERPGLDR